MPSMSSLLRGAVNGGDAKGRRVQRKPVNCVHDNDASVLAVCRCEVLEQGKFDAAVVVVGKVVDARVTDPVVKHLQHCDRDDDNVDMLGDGASDAHENNADEETSPACSRLCI
jgi:hypothetical protein